MTCCKLLIFMLLRDNNNKMCTKIIRICLAIRLTLMHQKRHSEDIDVTTNNLYTLMHALKKCLLVTYAGLHIVQTLMSCTAHIFFAYTSICTSDMHSSYNGNESMDKSSQALTITIAVAISYGLHGLTLHLSLSIIVDMILFCKH